jgi:uncharacterized protein YhjY with autotransporter beta-barrel domain
MRTSLDLALALALSAYAHSAMGLQAFAASATEDDGVARVQFFADDATRPLEVRYSTEDGSAQAGSDYRPQSGVLVWEAGDNSIKTVEIPLVNDTAKEDRESFAIVADYDRGDGSVIEKRTAIVIADDDANQADTIALERANLSASEGTRAILNVRRAGAGSGEASVDFAVRAGTATQGIDYNAPAAGTLTWADGETGVKTIEVDIVKDDVAEDRETLSASLSNPSDNVDLGNVTTTAIAIADGGVVVPAQQTQSQQEQSVAQTVNAACNANPNGALADRCRELSQLTDAQKQNAVAQIAPTQYTAPVAQAIKLAGSQTRNLQNRLGSLRSNRATQALSLNFNGLSINGSQLAQALTDKREGGAAGDEDSRFFDGRLGFFFQGRLQKSDKITRRTIKGTETGFGSEVRAATAGVDYRFLDDLVMGLAIGYDSTALNYSGHLGAQDIDTIKGMFYGSYYLPHDFYVDWIAGYGGNHYASRRNIAYTGFSGAAKSSPNGNQYDFGLSVGKDFSIGAWQLTPYGRFEYLELAIDPYQENGDTGYEMAFGKYTARSLTTAAGGKISYALSLPWGVLTPAARFEWLHEYSNGSQNIGGRLVNAAPGLGMIASGARTLNPDRDYFNLEGSLVAILPEGRSAFLRYESRLGQDTISSHSVEAGVRIPF